MHMEFLRECRLRGSETIYPLWHPVILGYLSVDNEKQGILLAQIATLCGRNPRR